MFDFEKLTVYSRLEEVSVEILRFVFTDRQLDPFVKDQLKRAIISIQLNLAEGTGRITPADKKHFYAMARSSLFESVALLRILKLQEIVSASQYAVWYDQMEEVSKMLLGLIRNT